MTGLFEEYCDVGTPAFEHVSDTGFVNTTHEPPPLPPGWMVAARAPEQVVSGTAVRSVIPPRPVAVWLLVGGGWRRWVPGTLTEWRVSESAQGGATWAGRVRWSGDEAWILYSPRTLCPAGRARGAVPSGGAG